MNDIPAGWYDVNFSELCYKIRSGGTPTSSNEEYYSGDIPFVIIADITNSGKYIKKTKKHITQNAVKSSSTWLVPENSLLYTMYATLGESSINKVPVTTNQAILGVVPNSKKINLEFFYYKLCWFKQFLHQYTAQTTQSNLNAKKVKSFNFVIPRSLNEQEKITDVLHSIDCTIEQTNYLIHKNYMIKQGLMNDFFSNSNWKFDELRNITLKIADRDHTTPIYVDNGVPIISPKDFNEFDKISFEKCKYISEKDHLINSKKTDIKTNDLIFTRIGAQLGKICIVNAKKPEFSILHSAALIRANKKRIHPLFLLYSIKSNFLQKQIKDGIQSIGVPDLGLEKINLFIIKYPEDMNEQEKISQILLCVDNVIEKESSYKKKLLNIKAGLMEDLLTGRVRVVV
jgi:type I restriction enzyme, S subunit